MGIALEKITELEEQQKISQIIDVDQLTRSLQEKYILTDAEIDESISVLVCFLLEKSLNHKKLIVLPQFVDWVWHELILNTRKYQEICDSLVGDKISHAMISPNEIVYRRSCQLFKHKYGFITDRWRWKNSGWRTPQYRFKTTLVRRIKNIEKRYFEKAKLHQNTLSKEQGYFPQELNWLVDRISTRFDIANSIAFLAVSEYFYLLSNEPEYSMNYASPIALWAWQEHVLWTKIYSSDCFKYVGRFVHRPSICVDRLFPESFDSDLNVGVQNGY